MHLPRPFAPGSFALCSLFILALYSLLTLASAAALPALAQTVGAFSLPTHLADSAETVRWVQPVAAFCEGPAWDGEGALYFTEQRGKDTAEWPIWKLDLADPAGTASVFLAASSFANGLAFDPAGSLVACQRRRVSRLSPGNSVALADSSADLPFGFANDLSFASDGSFFFTALDSLLFRVGPDGKAAVAARGLRAANGVLRIEEDGSLYVGEADAGVVRCWNAAQDGTLRDGKVHVRMARPDGMCMDALGNLYVADVSQGRVRALSPAGDSLGHIALDPPAPWNGYKRGANGNASNCEFGGEDGRTLFITGDGGLFALRMKVAGRVLPRPTGLRPPAPADPMRRDNMGWKTASGPWIPVLRAGTVAGRLQGPVLLGRTVR